MLIQGKKNLRHDRIELQGEETKKKYENEEKKKRKKMETKNLYKTSISIRQLNSLRK